jgi:phosphatidylglycerol:prolipoprotein diacylglycerol transferase
VADRFVRTTPVLARRTRNSPVELTDFTCSALEDADPQALGISYWFEARPSGERYAATVHLSGRLVGKAEPTAGRTTFDVVSTVDNVIPGSGQIAVTTRVADVAAGTWNVTATPVEPARASSGPRWTEVRAPGRSAGTASGRTGAAALVRNLAPGVHLGVWPAAVGAGFLLGLVLQGLLARALGLPSQQVLALTFLASAFGLVAAKVYYILTHRGSWRGTLTTGLSVQGFVITALGTLIGGALLLGIPVGPLLDATAPPLLLGMAVGRVGCLFAGCCVGRPTSSRWGVWSSDRRLGLRRIPVQLLESSTCALLGVLALLAVLAIRRSGGGLVLASGLAAYVLGRQLLFPLRNLPRATSHGRWITLGVSAVVLAGSAGALLLT